MNRTHLLYCGAVVALAIIVLVAVGTSASTLGFLALAIACPLMMLVMMRQMMGGRPGPHPE